MVLHARRVGLFALLASLPAITDAQQSPPQASAQTQPSSSDSKSQARFSLRTISDGLLCPRENLECDDKGIFWKNFMLLASDGHRIDLTSIPFPSYERSKQKFESIIKTADKVLRRESESNRKGEQVGERALVFFPEDSKARSRSAYYLVIWTRGSSFWEITGEHLDDVLALENRLNEEGVAAVWSWHEPLKPQTPTN